MLVASTQRALLRLKTACEDIKCALSDVEATVKRIGKLSNPIASQTFEAGEILIRSARALSIRIATCRE